MPSPPSPPLPVRLAQFTTKAATGEQYAPIALLAIPLLFSIICCIVCCRNQRKLAEATSPAREEEHIAGPREYPMPTAYTELRQGHYQVLSFHGCLTALTACESAAGCPVPQYMHTCTYNELDRLCVAVYLVGLPILDQHLKQCSLPAPWPGRASTTSLRLKGANMSTSCSSSLRFRSSRTCVGGRNSRGPPSSPEVSAEQAVLLQL